MTKSPPVLAQNKHSNAQNSRKLLLLLTLAPAVLRLIHYNRDTQHPLFTESSNCMYECLKISGHF